MSIDEKSLRGAQAQLLPGEILAWAGAAAAPRRTRLALLVGAAMFLGVVILGMGVGGFDSFSFSFFVVAGVFSGAFAGAVALVIPAALDHAHDKPTHYAITNRRILFLSTRTGETIPVAAYRPEDIQFVRRQDRRDGTSDLFIRHADGPRRGTVGVNGIEIPYQVPTPDVALRGVADVGAVEALIVALRSGALFAPAAAPAAPVSPPAALVSPLDEPSGEQEILFKKSAIPPLAGAIFALCGLPFLGFGIAAGLGRVALRSGEGASATPASPLMGLLISGGMGLLSSLIGFGLLLWRDVFMADPAARTYRIQRGFMPFAKAVAGTFADFEGICLTREDVTDSESQYKIFWHIRLHWKKAGRKPYDILATPYAPHGAGEAARMAAALGLPLDDRSAEVTPTKRKAQAVQAEPQTPERKERRRRLKITGGIALGLLLVNSFVKGVVWEDQWTAPDGSAIMRRTTGFWWQTVAISPQGGRSSQTRDQYFFYTSSVDEGTLPDVSGPRTNYRCGLRLGSRMAADGAPVPLPFLSPGQAATDSFQAAPGATLSGQGGGTGWAGNWSGTGALVAAGSLADPSGALTVGGQSVHLSAPGGQFVSLNRRLAFLLGGENTTAWISFTIKRTRLTPATAPPAFGGVCLGLTGRDPQLFIGDTGSGRWGMNTAGGQGTVNARRVEVNVPVFLVVRADFRPGGDRFTLYQNPTPGRIAPNVAGVVKTDLTISGVDGVALTAGNGNAYTLDELRLGISYHNVAPSCLKHAPDNGPAVSPS